MDKTVDRRKEVIEKKRVFVLKRLADTKQQRHLLESQFNFADSFFKYNPNVIIGKVPVGTTLANIENNERFRSVESKPSAKVMRQGIQTINKSSSKIQNKQSRISSSSYSSDVKALRQKGINYDRIDDNKLESVFKRFRELKYQNIREGKNKINLPEPIKEKLERQENHLELVKGHHRRSRQFQENLADKVHRTQDELLMSSLPKYREKYEVKLLLEEKSKKERSDVARDLLFSKKPAIA